MANLESLGVEAQTALERLCNGNDLFYTAQHLRSEIGMSRAEKSQWPAPNHIKEALEPYIKQGTIERAKIARQHDRFGRNNPLLIGYKINKRYKTQV